jgi:hypothetical protein
LRNKNSLSNFPFNFLLNAVTDLKEFKAQTLFESLSVIKDPRIDRADTTHFDSPKLSSTCRLSFKGQ